MEKNLIGLAEKLGKLLQEKNKTLAVAESCTGGGLAYFLTEIAGASSWFQGGIVAYANECKTKFLDVPEEMIAKHGAVSEEVARAMALGARKRVGTDIALSTTGIAGPGGGTPAKPVGTVCMAVACGEEVFVTRKVFSGDRHAVRTQAIEYILQAVCELVLSKDVVLSWR